MMTYAAACTERLRLGWRGLRDPCTTRYTAKALSSLDSSAGPAGDRVGTVAGSAVRRVRRLRGGPGVQVSTQAGADEEPLDRTTVTLDGRFWQLEHHASEWNSKPFQKPYPRSVRRQFAGALRRADRHGNGSSAPARSHGEFARPVQQVRRELASGPGLPAHVPDCQSASHRGGSSHRTHSAVTHRAGDPRRSPCRLARRVRRGCARWPRAAPTDPAQHAVRRAGADAPAGHRGAAAAQGPVAARGPTAREQAGPAGRHGPPAQKKPSRLRAPSPRAVHQEYRPSTRW